MGCLCENTTIRHQLKSYQSKLTLQQLLILSSLLFYTKLGYVYAISKSLQMVCMKWYRKCINYTIGRKCNFWRVRQNYNKKVLQIFRLTGLCWRRERDSNPRYLAVRRFSRPVYSTTLPSLLTNGSRRFWLICECKGRGFYLNSQIYELFFSVCIKK